MPSPCSAPVPVVDVVIEHLERGVVPWRLPWTAASPANLFTRRPYKGIHHLLLRMDAIRRGYASPWWITGLQATQRRGRILPEQVRNPVLLPASASAGNAGEVALGEGAEEFAPAPLRLYNFEQTRGLGRLVPAPSNLDFWSPSDAERIVLEWKDAPQQRRHVDGTTYDPWQDCIRMPPRRAFANADEYHAELFPLLIHATGHPARLARFPRRGPDGDLRSPAYALESLTAELGASFLCGEARIAPRPIPDDSPRISAWTELLRGDRSLLAVAARQGERACDLVLGRGAFARRPRDSTASG